jgi:hypothetical protein
MVAGLVLCYVWAWHIATPDPDFPTRWLIFQFSIAIWLFTAVITTVVFVLPLWFVRQSSGIK